MGAAHTIPMRTIAYLKQTGKNFCKCGITGWCLEVVFTSVESIMLRDWRLMGRTSLWMFPIYGMGALLAPIGRGVDRWLDVRTPVRAIWDGTCNEEVPLPEKERMVRHGLLYMVLIFLAEYATGTWLRQRGFCPWDYTGRHSNVNGLIRLDFAPLWFATGLLFEEITKKKYENKGA